MAKRATISVRGARQNNLKNIDVDIPRDTLTVITGVSGSGKSSLAFEVIYAEGQRRFLDSISTFARRRIQQVKRADVDFVYGLSAVVAIEQKKGISNPRSTVGTMTDINDYLRLLFASAGSPTCPYCGTEFQMHSIPALAELALSLPKGTRFKLLAPVYKIFDETYTFLFDEVRKKGYRYVTIDGVEHNLSSDIDLEEHLSYNICAVTDSFVVTGEDQYKSFTRALESGFKNIGEGFLILDVDKTSLPEGYSDEQLRAFNTSWGCPEHHIAMAEPHPIYFAFNDADGACRTCTGIGMHKRAEPSLMILNPEKSIRGGALAGFVLNPSIWSYKTIIVYNLAKRYGFDLDTPWKDLSDEAKHLIFYGTGGERITMEQPEEAIGEKNNWIVGRTFAYDGITGDINRWYKRWMEKPVSDSYEEAALDRVMVEYICPDCNGTKLKPQRLCVRIGGKNISEVCRMPFPELKNFLQNVQITREKNVGQAVIKEIVSRVELLLDIGLYYLSLDRRSDTISGGEAQRIRLSTQISSGLMGMLYVLDEPSIGLHARDSERIINTMKRLRDIGNTVLVVEHDMETMMHADHIIEIGPGPGSKGGQIVAQGTPSRLMKNPDSVTGRYLSGKLTIPPPAERRKPLDIYIEIKGASEHNLRHVDVRIPLGVLLCISGVSGSGKSTLVHDILYKRLHQLFYDPRTQPGAHESLTGHEHINNVINIDQQPIGRNSRSNPATYVGFYDKIRLLFSQTKSAIEHGYTDKDFSFNHKNGGRCEECSGEGVIVRELQFMADIETICPVCNGARFNKEILEIKYKDKNISDVLEMSIEEALAYFDADDSASKYIRHKLGVLNDLGLTYLKLGQSSTTLSGGEAQRIKLATELGKMRRGQHNLYILDEPTTGLHMADISMLLRCLNGLVEKGHSVLVIEHHMHVLHAADYIIDLGPEGGINGGEIIATGTPEQIVAEPRSLTGRFLAELTQNN